MKFVHMTEMAHWPSPEEMAEVALRIKYPPWRYYRQIRALVVLSVIVPFWALVWRLVN